MRKLCLEHAQLYDKLYPSQRSCLHGSVLDTPTYGFKLQRIHFGKQPHGKIHIHCKCSSIFKSMYFERICSVLISLQEVYFVNKT